MIYTHSSASLPAAWGRRDSRDTGFAQWGGFFPKKSVYFCISYSAWQLCVFIAHLRYETHRDVNKVEFKQKRRGKFSDGSTGGKKKRGKVDLPSTKSCNASVPFDVRHKCPLWVSYTLSLRVRGCAWAGWGWGEQDPSIIQGRRGNVTPLLHPSLKLLPQGLSCPAVTDLREAAGKKRANGNELQEAGTTLMCSFSRVQLL